MARRNQSEGKRAVQHEGGRHEASAPESRELSVRYRGGKIPRLAPKDQDDDHRQGRGNHGGQFGRDPERISSNGPPEDPRQIAGGLPEHERKFVALREAVVGLPRQVFSHVIELLLGKPVHGIQVVGHLNLSHVVRLFRVVAEVQQASEAVQHQGAEPVGHQ